MFPVTFSSDSLQICYIYSLYQYVGVYKLIYFIIFFVFLCFITVFTKKNMAWENVKVSDYIMFPMKFSSDSLQICYIYSLYQYVGVYKLIYFIIFFVFCVLSPFLLRKIWPGKMLKFLIKSCFLWSSPQKFFKFATWIHCIILISMLVFISWYILSFSSVYQFILTVLLRKILPGVKTCFLWSSYQNLFKF